MRGSQKGRGRGAGAFLSRNQGKEKNDEGRKAEGSHKSYLKTGVTATEEGGEDFSQVKEKKTT